MLTYQFPYMTECPVPLLGRDILSKLHAQIMIKEIKIQIHIPEEKAVEAQVLMLQKPSTELDIPEEVENTVTPLVWATGALG